MMTRIPSLARSRQDGIALIEALLAAVLLAIGLLGTVGLQTRAVTALSEAGLRAEATIAAERLLGVMTTDPTNLTAYRLAAGATPGSRLAQWHSLVKESMPGATVVVTVTPPAGPSSPAPSPSTGVYTAPVIVAPPSEVTIAISWQRQANGQTNRHFVRAFI